VGEQHCRKWRPENLGARDFMPLQVFAFSEAKEEGHEEDTQDLKKVEGTADGGTVTRSRAKKVT